MLGRVDSFVPTVIFFGRAIASFSTGIRRAPRRRDTTSPTGRQNNSSNARLTSAVQMTEQQLKVFDDKAIPIAILAGHATTGFFNGNRTAPCRRDVTSPTSRQNNLMNAKLASPERKSKNGRLHSTKMQFPPSFSMVMPLHHPQAEI
jgi:hypothetical protein